MVFSVGSNQGTNIYGSADPNTTGGHKDTAGRRMISNYGIEDCCGVLWQWASDTGHTGSNTEVNSYDSNDRSDVRGQTYWDPVYRALVGASGSSGASCGSRGSDWKTGALYLGANCGGRGASEPLGRNA